MCTWTLFALKRMVQLVGGVYGGWAISLLYMYAPRFVNFSREVIACHAKSHVPVCDNNYKPPLCSNLYHDQSQTPGYPKGDGNCAAPACDVGGVPVGECESLHPAAPPRTMFMSNT